MTLFRYSRRELRRRPGRTALTLLGIAIGVAAIVAISITIGTTRAAYRETFESLAGRAELEIVAEGGGRFPSELAHTVSQVPGVKIAVPGIQNHTALVSPKGVIGVMLFAIDSRQDDAVRDYSFAQGRQLQRPGEIVLEESFARSYAVRLGDTVRVLCPQGTTELSIVGLLKPKGPAALAGGNLAIVGIDTAQRMYGLGSVVNTIYIVLDGSAALAEVQRRVAAALPEGLMVEPPAMRGQLTQYSLLTTEQGLSSMSAVSLVAGAFMVMNTFLMNLSERRRQVAILRALGATRSQVLRLLLSESLFLGISGTILGIGIGVALSMGLTVAVSKVIGAPLPVLRLTATPFMLAILFGPGMAIVTTLIPAHRAAHRSILADLLGTVRDEERRSRRWPALVGLVLLAMNLSAVALILNGRVSQESATILIPPAMAGFLISCMLLIPIVVPALGQIVGRALHPLLGVEGKLALRQLQRRPTRTALTVGVLFIAIVVSISMGNALINNIRDIQEWCRRTITSDYLIRSVMPDTGLMAAAAINERIAQEVARMKEVAHVNSITFLPVNISGQKALLLARTQSPGSPLSLDLYEGEPQQVLKGLLSGEVVLGTTLSRRLKVHPGDSIALATRQGERRLKVAGITTEYTVGGMALYMERDFAVKMLNLRGVDTLMVSAVPGQAARLGQRLQEFCEQENLLLQSQQDFRAVIDQMMAGVTGSLWLLMSLVFVVASLGIVNTLTINALEQTREFGVLRAVGMWRRRVRKMVLAEALTMALVSVLPGCVVGIALARLMNATIYPVMGHPVEFRLEIGLLLICIALAVLISMLAAIGPARRVAALNIVRALQYE